MKTTPYTRYGNALLISIAMIISAMVLHPFGGSIEYIQKIATVIIVSHSIAIIAMPLTVMGFWGLHKKLEDESLLSLVGFITITIGMFAGICAAAINGLALPLYANGYIGATPEIIESIRPIFKYGLSLNYAFDFIFIGFCCLAILLWSISLIRTKALPVWLGWLGVVLVVLVILIAATGFTLVNLTGFRIFIGGLVAWMILVAMLMKRAS